MEIQRNAPTLAGVKACPSCKAQIEKDAVLCIHCGYNLATGEKVGGSSFANNKKIVWLGAGAGLLVVAALAASMLLRSEPPPPPPFVPDVQAPAATPPPAAAVEGEPEVLEVAAEPEPADEPEEPARPTPEELAAAEAEAQRIEFQARKVQAQATLRQQMEEREPMFTVGETIEVRRRNGLVHTGELQGYAGSGTNRVAVITTSTGEIGVPLLALDPPSRRRLDAEFREAFMDNLIRTRFPEGVSP